MKVGDICTRQAVTVTPRTPVATAAVLMRERHVGCLVVVEPGLEPAGAEPQHLGSRVGMVTERDIVVSVVARGADPQTVTVADVMTRQRATVTLDDSIHHALRWMRHLGARHLPVVGRDGLIAGVISLEHVVQVLASQVAHGPETAGGEPDRRTAARP